MSLDQALDVILACNLCGLGLSFYLWLVSEIYQLLTAKMIGACYEKH